MAWKEGDEGLAAEKQERIGVSSGIVGGQMGVPGLKFACDLNGYYGGRARLPLLPLTAEEQQEVSRLMADIRFLRIQEKSTRYNSFEILLVFGYLLSPVVRVSSYPLPDTVQGSRNIIRLSPLGRQPGSLRPLLSSPLHIRADASTTPYKVLVYV